MPERRQTPLESSVHPILAPGVLAVSADRVRRTPRPHLRRARPEGGGRVIRQLARPDVSARDVVRARPLVSRRAELPAVDLPSSGGRGPTLGPYVDYGRFLTPEGGILIVYKDIDTRLRYTLWRIFAWTASTGGEAWFLYHHSPHPDWVNVVALFVLAVLNVIVVMKPVELYRRVEIRPDCMILDGGEIFWLRQMENGYPGFQTDDEGNQILCGIYGTRWVEYLTVRRFDDFDRMPDVFMAHFQYATAQLWGRAGEFR
jgi:hypothetical protein